MNRHAHMGNAVRPMRRPTTEEWVCEVSSFQPLEVVGCLTARVRQTLGDAMKKEFAPLGVTLAQCIAIIGLSGGIASTAAEICRGMPYDPGSMTRMLDHLERLGYLRRERSTEDRRVMKLVLTEQGKAVYAQAIEAGARTFARRLRAFSKQEGLQLEASLQQTLANAWAQKL
jgi:MarR family transcriptional regulator, multiple antibiotic resistance protein MarR